MPARKTRKPIRPIQIIGDVAHITLTQGKIAVIDAIDAPLVADRNWCAARDRNTFYAVSSTTLQEAGEIRRLSLHRVLLGAGPDIEVDHRDGDGLNCRRENLREATHAQNMANRAKQRNSSTGFTGVCWHARTGKWQASIKVNGKNRYLGLYLTPEEAHAAHVEAAKQHHGEFSRALSRPETEV